MRDILFRLQPSAPISLQAQIRENLVSAICARQLAAGERVPSSRHLANQLNVSRNTVSLEQSQQVLLIEYVQVFNLEIF